MPQVSPSPTRLDIVIPTYNRARLLAKTLASIAAAHKPAGLELGVIVVDNNSADETQSVVAGFNGRLGAGLRCILERKQGRSHALNAGISASSADLVGMIDDDEEIDAEWIVEAARQFENPDLDFAGGPCLPNWGDQA